MTKRSSEDTARPLSWWHRTETPRCWLIIFGVFFVVMILGSSQFAFDDRRAELRFEHFPALNASMAEFETLSSTFVASVQRRDRVHKASRSRLVRNLNEQFAYLRLIELHLPRAAHGELQTQRKAIVSLINATWGVDNASSLEAFSEAKEEWLMAREALETHLPSSHKDMRSGLFSWIPL